MPGPDSVVTGAGPPGWVVAAFQYAVNYRGSNTIRDAQIRAANQAGYTRAAGYNAAQQLAVGQGLRMQQQIAAGTLSVGGGSGPMGQGPGPNWAGPRGVAAQPTPNLPAVVPQPPPVFNPPSTARWPDPPSGSGSGSSGIPPRPPPSPTTPPINPNAPPMPGPVIGVSWPLIVTSVLGPYVVPAVLQGGAAAWDWIKAGRPIPKGPTSRRRRSPHRGPGPKEPGKGDPFPPGGPQVTVIVNMPEPKPPKKEPDPMAGLGNIYVTRRRLPVPTYTPPKPPPPKTPLWLQLLPIVGPSLFSFLGPGQGNRTTVRLQDPLTRPVTDGNPFPLTQPQTLVQSFGAFGPPQGAVGTNTCECKAPRKKGRRKKRTVCYSGTFIERADGTRKTKKRKVQC